MKVLVLGAGGMLGHKMCQILAASGFDVRPVFHKPVAFYTKYEPFIDLSKAVGGLDATDEKSLLKLLDEVVPDAIINCVGVTSRKIQQVSATKIIQLNAKLPHVLEQWTEKRAKRFIHFSTDCVFTGHSGQAGAYKENQSPDATDLYGRSKALGEVSGANSLTIRSSIVGLELENRTELIEWLLSQNGKRIHGFTNAIYSGVTTNFMSRAVVEILRDHPDMNGIYQLASSPISKFELLRIANAAFGHKSEINPDGTYVCDKSLDGSRLTRETGIAAPSWTDMLQELATEKSAYETLRETVQATSTSRKTAPPVNAGGKILEGKTILVTGGTGSMGKTFVKRALSGVDGLPAKIIIMSRDEAKQHYMRQDYLNLRNSTDEVIYRNFQNILQFQIGDVRRYEDVCGALRGVDIVVNAAALKQVPICEYFPEQAFLTNCAGAQNIVRAIRDLRLPVETVVGVSTDKACKPVNVMGMSKALQERTFIAGNLFCEKTRFVCVRYGNVLASRGSVIPLFHEQIRANGPVTVTDLEMTRFLLTLEEAVDTVLAAIATANAGEVLVPIAPAATMLNVARALIGQRKIEIIFTGIRPGEKMHEIMISDEEAARSYRKGQFYAIQPMLPELAPPSGFVKPELFAEFSSHSDVLDFAGTIDLLQRTGMMIRFDESPERHELVG